ncbi:MAG: hypothetical protein JSV86_01980 [Gemmatimonadota bacterium]|nr:MAG: hypothetical protein JSV86_01980 [Gemmatimonadota bacterium]
MRGNPALGIWALLVLSGCAGHASTMYDVRSALLRDDLEEARALLADAGRGTDDLLFALEDGLLLHVVGDPELSNQRFEFAEWRVDELYTKSITRAILSLLTSDLVLKFEPRGIESFLLNYYRALNYLQLGEPEEAWVEWRKLASKLQFSRVQGDAIYLDPPFFNYLAGLGLESDDPNDAYISLRLAEAAYREQGSRPPEDLIDDLMQLAAYLGFGDHLDLYRSRYGERPSAPGRAHGGDGRESGRRGDWGEVVLLVEDGLVAPILEANAYVPITVARAEAAFGDDRDLQLELAGALAQEYGHGDYDGVTERYAERPEVAYILPLSFPVYGRGDPALRRLIAVIDADTAIAEPLLQISDLQQAAFEDRLLGMYAKTIARALVKYAVAAALKEEAEEEGGEAAGEVVGFLTNVVNMATERADTRAWLGLPHRIWVTRLTVPAGRHEVRILIDGLEEVSLGSLDVWPGERVFLSYRVF